MKFYVLLFMIMGYASLLKSQTIGLVVDGEEHSPLSGVNIYRQKDSVGIGMTDDEGRYEIRNSQQISAHDTVVFSYVGYYSVKCTMEELKRSSYKVVMYSYPQELAEVTVKGEHGRIFMDCDPLKPLPKKLYSFASFLHDGKIYVVSGNETSIQPALPPFIGLDIYEYLSNRMYIYDISRDVWEVCRHPFICRTGHAAHYYKNKIIVLGGKYFSINRKLEYTVPQIEIYDMEKDTVYIDNVNPHQAVNPITFVYQDCLYVMGGSIKKNLFSSKMHIFDLKNGIWYDAGITIPKDKRDITRGVLVGHIVYLFGGESSTSKCLVRSYNLQTGVWSDLCELKAMVASPGVAVNGSLIYIYENNTLQTYSIKENVVNLYHVMEEMEGSGILYDDGKLYIVGGCKRKSNFVYPYEDVYSIDVSNISPE